MKDRLLSVNFGSSYGGLTTVGYALYNKNGTVFKANTTTGVTEIGTSTGCYCANPIIDDKFDGTVLWTTGGGSPKYALQVTFTQLNQIQDETDNIRLILNSMRNQGEALNKLTTLTKEKKNADAAELKNILANLDKLNVKEFPKLQEIKDSLKESITNFKIPAPIFNTPKVEIPNYASQFDYLNNEVAKLTAKINNIPKEYKYYSDNMKSVLGNLLHELGSLGKKLETAQDKIEKADSNFSNTVKPGKILQDIYSVLQQGQELKKVMQEYEKKNKDWQMLGLGV